MKIRNWLVRAGPIPVFSFLPSASLKSLLVDDFFHLRYNDEKYTIAYGGIAMANILYEQNGVRVSLLTPCLLRVETGSFTDLPTQTVLNRDLGEVTFTLEVQEGGILRIITAEAEFFLDTQTGAVSSVLPAGMPIVTDLEQGMLPGTARTLDQANGAVKLEKGILSRSGAGMMDDSKRLLLLPDGTVEPRPECTDKYYFAYGHDYTRQLQDFFRLTGPVPLIPKYALGNWWSRYKAYTQEEYRNLMQQFMDRKLPITVATIDMDWHWVDVLDRFGKEAKPGAPRSKEEVFYNNLLPGWTGYSWNTELFPDHKQLLDWLHEQGFHITMNVHPSQGVRFFEDRYEAMCRRMGIDPASKEIVSFDASNPQFWQAYFEELHHPLEAEGVDFWWLDWQQGKNTEIPGLDPLWALNHYHTRDAARGEKRPLILSRYSGLGSHRYPLGFSGDSFCTWKSLDFQPYFTNCAANAGYTWWSHDIGGHMRGVQSDELYVRWLQYGVFSPINRLHSSNSPFMGKEPWKRSWAAEQIASQFLRLRHKLIPYLYSANYQTHKQGMPICSPMYYHYDCEDAYKAKNEYIFGGQLLVCPITRPADKRLNLAYADVWLPEGRWTDIFNGRTYRGGRWVRMYRDLDSMPVLAGAGAIVPMYRNVGSNDLSLEQPLEVHLWRGNSSFTLYEDDGETMAYADGKAALTHFCLEENGNTLRLTITPPQDHLGLLPQQRQIYLKFRDLDQEEMCITLGDAPVSVELTDVKQRKAEPIEELENAILTRVQGSNDLKSLLFGKKLPKFVRDAIEELKAMEQ